MRPLPRRADLQVHFSPGETHASLHLATQDRDPEAPDKIHGLCLMAWDNLTGSILERLEDIRSTCGNAETGKALSKLIRELREG